MLFVKAGSQTLSAIGVTSWWDPFIPAIVVILFFRWLARPQKANEEPRRVDAD